MSLMVNAKVGACRAMAEALKSQPRRRSDTPTAHAEYEHHLPLEESRMWGLTAPRDKRVLQNAHSCMIMGSVSLISHACCVSLTPRVSILASVLSMVHEYSITIPKPDKRHHTTHHTAQSRLADESFKCFISLFLRPA